MRRMVIGYSAGNYQIMDKESTGGEVIPPEVTILLTQGINLRKGNSTGSYQLADTTNQPEER
jgi:hypothetical protein